MKFGRKWRYALAGAGAVALLLFGMRLHRDYWETTRDLRSLGFEWIEVWTPREVERHDWMDSSLHEYRFALTDAQEAELRKRCDPNDRLT